MDDHSKYTWIFLLKKKYDTGSCIINFVNIIKSDNGSELHMPSYYSSLCIVHQTSYVETPH
ncbi:hypothetical protein CR513_43737, partial [Mucuna pruriens]